MLEISNLSISFKEKNKYVPVVNSLSLEVRANEIMAIIGESGSGKSITALSVLKLLQQGLCKVDGSITLDGKEILTSSEKEIRNIRGGEIGFVFQEPMSALNPSMQCGEQIAEVLKQHTALSPKEIKKTVLELLSKVKISAPESVFYKYPHEISGGQKQRIVIAMAISCKPKLLIADEPTTALDSIVQNEIISLIKSIQIETGMGVLFISHDINLVSRIANRIAIMLNGTIVEQGKVSTIFECPKHPYTKALLASRPQLGVRFKRLPVVSDFLNHTVDTSVVLESERKKVQHGIYQQAPLLEIKNLTKVFSKHSLFRKPTCHKALNGVSFDIYEGETLGLLGQSGCGKTTLGNIVMNLEKPTAGEVLYRGKNLNALKAQDLKRFRKDVQVVFQDPYTSLNPKLTVGEAITEPMVVHRLYSSFAQCKSQAIELLLQVGLSEAHYNRYPHQFSGGQRQRINIGRALAVKPKLLVCDEAVSALDISVQAQILNLLNDLKALHGLTYLFISHDLTVVYHISDRVAVMNSGKLEELGDTDEVYKAPQSLYTQKLLAGSF